MNDILLKVQTYLDKCNKESIEISDTLVEEFGEACKSALRKQFSEQRREGFKPRMSSIGRPLCQLQMEAKNVKGEGQPYNVKMRNTFGDLVEALAIFVMKSAGVEVKDEQKKGGNVYYTPEIAVNADAGLEMSKEDMETLGVFQEVITKENTEVIDLYKAAKKSNYDSSDKDMKKVVDQVEDPVDVLAS